MCTVNKSVHTKKVWKLIECTSYHNTFQTAMLTETIRAYPFLDRERLHNELSVLYEGEEMWHENLLDF